MNFYDILKINSCATKEEIKLAYYTQAKIYHPDKNGSPDAHEKFVNIKNAYEILTDDIKRREYDMMSSEEKVELYDILKNYFTNKDPEYKHVCSMLLKKFNIKESDLRDDINNFNFKNLYNNFFYKIFNNNNHNPNSIPIYNSGSSSSISSSTNTNIYGFITATLKDKYLNKFKKITVTRSCNNSKTQYIVPLNEDEVIIKGAGEEKNNITGDVILRIVCQEDPDFKCMNDYNIYTVKVVSLSQYIYGATVHIKHLDDEILELKFDSCLDTVPLFCFKNKGMLLEGTDRGDLYVHIKVHNINSIYDTEHANCIKSLLIELFPPI